MGSDSPQRARYNKTLAAIEADVLHMGSIVLEMIELAVKAAVEEDHSLVERVLLLEAETDAAEASILDAILRTQVLEGPVARDALLLSSAVGLVTELEKAGDEAAKLASRIVKLGDLFPDDLLPKLEAMAAKVVGNLRDCLALFQNYDRALSDRIIALDDEVDREYKACRNEVLERMQRTPERARQWLRCTEVFHALEHISDHAVEISKRVRACYDHGTRD